MPFVRPAPVALVATCALGLALAAASGCGALLGDGHRAVVGIGDPCTPEGELDPNGGGAYIGDTSLDVASTSCDSRVCLAFHFQGRVTCPFGNGQRTGQVGTCSPVPDFPGLYTLDGAVSGELCCPVQGDVSQTPLHLPVEAQCSAKRAIDSVYCSCRCDVPAGVDRATTNLCACPSGFACVPILEEPALPSGVRGSYCLRQGPLGAELYEQWSADPSDSSVLTRTCGAPRTPAR